ncbi:MAG: hypothetical protein KAI02_03355 [Gammaproteobacteria bacterium]|nr:hypothetical protein [Gammaproteobacteria bacterium]
MKLITLLVILILCSGLSHAAQRKLSYPIQYWTGTNGVLDIYMGENLVKRFINIDKLSSAQSMSGTIRDYRYGYGVLDANLNYKADVDEKKIYFEVSSYATSYIFYESPM